MLRNLLERFRHQPEQPQSKPMLKVIYEAGAAQLYTKETGLPHIVDGVTTPEAQAYIDKMLAPINFEDRTNWQDNGALEFALMQAMGNFSLSDSEEE